MDITIEIGNRIRLQRKRKNLSQERLSELSELHPTYIGQLERGEKTPSIETLYKVSSALDISLSTLLEGIEQYDTPKDTYSFKTFQLIERQTIPNQEHIYHIVKQITDMLK